MNVVWSPRAIGRVGKIARWIAQDRPLAAERGVEDLFAAATRLESFPESGHPMPARRYTVRTCAR